MNPKTLIWGGMIIGSFIGSFIPSLWGASSLSLSGVFVSALCGVLGIWIGFRLSRY